jgi:nucleoside-diphosphate-sugar epimerase
LDRFEKPEMAAPRSCGLINRFICLAADGRPLTILGTGEQKPDYICVDDTIIALLLCAMSPGCRKRPASRSSGPPTD